MHFLSSPFKLIYFLVVLILLNCPCFAAPITYPFEDYRPSASSVLQNTWLNEDGITTRAGEIRSWPVAYIIALYANRSVPGCSKIGFLTEFIGYLVGVYPDVLGVDVRGIRSYNAAQLQSVLNRKSEAAALIGEQYPQLAGIHFPADPDDFVRMAIALITNWGPTLPVVGQPPEHLCKRSLGDEVEMKTPENGSSPLRRP